VGFMTFAASSIFSGSSSDRHPKYVGSRAAVFELHSESSV
jgi:hypothetical protein